MFNINKSIYKFRFEKQSVAINVIIRKVVYPIICTHLFYVQEKNTLFNSAILFNSTIRVINLI